MKKIILGLVLASSLSTAFAGTATLVSFKEEKLAADTLSLVIPAMVTGNNASLEFCTKSNVAAPGRAPKYLVECEYKPNSASTFVGDVVFQVTGLDGDEVTGLKFLSLTPQKY